MSCPGWETACGFSSLYLHCISVEAHRVFSLDLSSCSSSSLHLLYCSLVNHWGVSAATMRTFAAPMIRLMCQVQRKKSFIIRLLWQLRNSGKPRMSEGFLTLILLQFTNVSGATLGLKQCGFFSSNENPLKCIWSYNFRLFRSMTEWKSPAPSCPWTRMRLMWLSATVGYMLVMSHNQTGWWERLGELGVLLRLDQMLLMIV